MIRLCKYKPSELPDETLNSAIELIQSKFRLTSEHLKTIILSKDIIHLYYDDAKLIGIIGFKWIVLDSAVFLYIGTTTVEDDYQQSGLLSRSITNNVIHTLIHYPFKKYKFVLAFVTTPQAYQYIATFNDTWPRPGVDTPPEILDLFKQFMQRMGDDQYYIKNGVVICTGLDEINELKPKKIQNQAMKDYFNSLTENGGTGLQVLCATPVSTRNVCRVIGRSLLKKVGYLIYRLKLFF